MTSAQATHDELMAVSRISRTVPGTSNGGESAPKPERMEAQGSPDERDRIQWAASTAGLSVQRSDQCSRRDHLRGGRHRSPERRLRPAALALDERRTGSPATLIRHGQAVPSDRQWSVPTTVASVESVHRTPTTSGVRSGPRLAAAAVTTVSPEVTKISSGPGDIGGRVSDRSGSSEVKGGAKAADEASTGCWPGCRDRPDLCGT